MDYQSLNLKKSNKIQYFLYLNIFWEIAINSAYILVHLHPTREISCKFSTCSIFRIIWQVKIKISQKFSQHFFFLFPNLQKHPPNFTFSYCLCLFKLKKIFSILHKASQICILDINLWFYFILLLLFLLLYIFYGDNRTVKWNGYDWWSWW